MCVCACVVMQGQQFALKAAVMLRAWLDRQCAAWGEAVRREGGLLVIGMSLQVHYTATAQPLHVQ